jgi:hypothetical protein
MPTGAIAELENIERNTIERKSEPPEKTMLSEGVNLQSIGFRSRYTFTACVAWLRNLFFGGERQPDLSSN